MPPSHVDFASAHPAPPPPDVSVIEVSFDREQRSRTSSGRSASIRSHPNSRGSGSSGRHSISGSERSWKIIDHPRYEYDDEVDREYEEDDLEPSDSASRARQRLPPIYTQTQPRPHPTRRYSSHRVREPAPDPPPQPEVEEPRRHRSSRRRRQSSHVRRHDSHRAPPSDESSLGTVASHDDYPYSHHGMPPPRNYPPQSAGYRQAPPQSHGGYPPSVAPTAPGYADGYGGRQALVHMPQQDPFGYPINNNPFSPQESQGNPFSPMSAASGASYFAMDPHAPPMPQQHRPQGPQRPQSYMAPSSHYGSEMMSPYGHPAMPPYPGYPPMPGYPMHGWYPPPSNASSPPPADESKEDVKKASKDQLDAIQAVLLKTEEARQAWHKEIVAKAEAEAAAAAEKKARDEEEKKKKEEIADASKKAKEAAEKKAEEAAKKAKDEHEKKLKEAEEAREEAVKKQKELEEETKKLKPPDHSGKSVKFTDAMGRKFSFPYHLCKTWKGMESLIKQAFMQIDEIGDHVRSGHYDLTGPDNEIILPQVWENMIQPDWEIEMHMWPMPEKESKKDKGKKNLDDLFGPGDPFAGMGLGDLGIEDPAMVNKKSGKKSGAKKAGGKSSRDANIVNVHPSGIPPPPNFPPGMQLPDPLNMAFPGEMVMKDKTKGRSKSSSGRNGAPTGFAAWLTGTSAPRKKR